MKRQGKCEKDITTSFPSHNIVTYSAECQNDGTVVPKELVKGVSAVTV
jgi:hypothetical protein